MLPSRRTVYEALELVRHTGRWPVAFEFAWSGLIFANLVATVLESMQAVAGAHGPALALFHAVSMVLFTVELGVRFWVCTADAADRYVHPLWGRVRYIFSTLTLLDVIAVAPYWLGVTLDLRFARTFRLLRMLHFFGYGDATESLATVFYNERKALIGALITMMFALFVTSSLMYLIEHPVQPEQFSSILNALWWGLATFATIGYGDITPVTAAGRVLTGVAAVFGIAMFALPAGILASGYASELKRRDFVITWELVARVPVFAKLPASKIADIAGMLRVRQVRAGEVIVRKGDPANSMYFIAEGEVLVDIKPHPIRLRNGEFFGEMGLLERAPRSATVSATRTSRLLMLEAQDLARFLDGNPTVRETLTRATADRLLHQQEIETGSRQTGAAGVVTSR